jgi:hypothetical protein
MNRPDIGERARPAGWADSLQAPSRTHKTLDFSTKWQYLSDSFSEAERIAADRNVVMIHPFR